MCLVSMPLPDPAFKALYGHSNVLVTFFYVNIIKRHLIEGNM